MGIEGGLALTLDMVLVLGLLGLAVVLFIRDWVAPDVAALLILVMLGLMGLVAPTQLFAGFSSNAVMAVLAVMILGAGLDRTGLMTRTAGSILRLSQGDERRLILALSLFAGAVSAFMQNPAVTALFLPVASRIATRTGYPLAQLLMPMAFCVVLGGTMTLIGNSPMILLNDLIASANRNLPAGAQAMGSLSLVSVLPIGLSLLLMGLAYFAYYGLKRLPSGEHSSATPGTTTSYFERLYGVQGGQVFELLVPADSPVAGRSFAHVEGLAGAPLLLALASGNEARIAPPGDEPVPAGAVLGVLGLPEDVAEFAEVYGLEVLSGHQHFAELLDPEQAGVAEAVIPPHSRFIGKAVGELRLRKRYGISALAIVRGEKIYRDDVRAITLMAGDCLILHSRWRDLAEHAGERDFLIVTDFPTVEARPQKLWHALIFFALGFALTLFVGVPLPVAMMAGAVGMLLTGVVSMDEAYKAINWKTIFLLASLIPLGQAMEATGAAAWIAQELVAQLGRMPSVLVQLAVALLTAAFAWIMGPAAAAVLMVPMAINIALALRVDPLVYALIAALGASNNFLTASNGVNALIAGPAGYRAADFRRVGLPLTACYALASVLLVNLFY